MSFFLRWCCSPDDHVSPQPSSLIAPSREQLRIPISEMPNDLTKSELFYSCCDSDSKDSGKVYNSITVTNYEGYLKNTNEFFENNI